MSEFRVQRVVPPTVDDVWTAFTDAERLRAWFWPPRLAAKVEVEPRVGGAFRIVSETAGMAVTGEYVEVAPPHRLVHTWRWEGEDEQTLVTMTFHPVAGGTGITILHERFTDPEIARQNEIGWNSCLDRLGEPIAG